MNRRSILRLLGCAPVAAPAAAAGLAAVAGRHPASALTSGQIETLNASRQTGTISWDQIASGSIRADQIIVSTVTASNVPY